ncbi:MAG: hypothetical protein CR965_00370 [Paludibacter sp.]|nr:MAG: hypothetical protein CR965_00370 [Paludibacter sp.]
MYICIHFNDTKLNDMKYRLKITLFFLLSFIVSQCLYSQNTYPTKSVKGVEYYVYQVQAGEGLYSISKKFNISQEEIKQVNGQIKNGLKAGESILVPKRVKQTDRYFLHKVTDKQTLFAIGQQYGVSVQDIVQLNPNLDKVGLLSGTTIKIPKKQVTKQIKKEVVHRKENETTPTNSISVPTSAFIHQVGTDETLYSIASKYHVTVKQILALNPNVKENIIEENMALLVPYSSIQKRKLKTKQHYKIAYFLPFMANSESVNPTAVKFIQFYMGALLAINNVKNKDIDFEILTYDIEKTETKLYEVLNNPEIQEVDLIFGPAYSLQIPILADFAKRRKIYTVIPFSSNVKYISSNPYVFQFNPNNREKETKIVDFLIDNFQTENIIFLRTGKGYGLDKNRFIKDELKKSSVPYQEVNGAYIKKFLSSDKKNIVIFDTNKYGASKQYLSVLYQHSYQYDIAVLGEYGWKEISGQRPKMYYVSPFNGTTKGTDYYEKLYHKFYAYSKPLTNPRFDLLGYDLTNFFISKMQKNNFNFKKKATLRYKGVQSDFIFNRENLDGGYVNKKLYILEDEAKNQ